ncbi:NFACT RNA binding domain-containing protein [Nafulsella turpanensis]|uniref:NFACT RNA binding domain-containing protein n=1 Tax=Nafulsella turpanensis TaxID=1265690 RepID=UPI00034839AD|nr:NFACT RNA binding domain-containing protein [Nafulsella turpanensis]
MHNNYYFLRQLTTQIGYLLPGLSFTHCYSQSKNELSLQFSSEEKSFSIKAHLQPDFSCLFFPDDLSRARRNSVDLFNEAIGQKVMEVIQYQNERSFLITLEQEWSLLFKMHGNRSNILLLKNSEPFALFKNKLAKDWNLKPAELNRALPVNEEAFTKLGGNYKKLLPTLGKLPAAYLQAQNYPEQPLEKQWILFSQMLHLLEKPEGFYLIELDGLPALSLLPFGTILQQFNEPIEAINRFFIAYTKEYTLELEKGAALQRLNKEIKSSQNYLEKTTAKLEEIMGSSKNREMADILMANLHAVRPGSTEVELYDFYHDRPVTIPLKKDLSPQKNAENFYRKAKNQQVEEKYLLENIESKEERLKTLQEQAGKVEETNDLKDLRNYLKSISLPENAATTETLPYRSFTFKDFQIWVGKGAIQNDDLIRYHAHKDDLWLHAKDVSGSHVILKRWPGKNFPVEVKEKAAQLAAWYSKRKQDSLCPVICTPRKWVRKQKGAAAGAVIVEKEEEVLLVPPAPFK